MGISVKGIMSVGLFGQPADMDPINEFAKNNRLWVLDDAAQSFGGKYNGNQIVDIIKSIWPKEELNTPYVVCTGGEPLLQLDEGLISIIHSAGFEIGIETNGTILPPKGIDWICVSPKSNADFILKHGNELKIVFPQCGMNPRKHENLDFNYFYIQPMDGPKQQENIKKSQEFIMKHPQWRLSLQTHKIMGIP